MYSSKTCPTCGKENPTRLPNGWLMVCSQCGNTFGIGIEIKVDSNMPDDLNLWKQGTTGSYQNSNFEITGRLRLHCKQDTINLWCAAHGNQSIWIRQSQDSAAIFAPNFSEFAGIKSTELGIRRKLEFDNRPVVRSVFHQSLEQLHMEGEISRFPFSDSIRVIEANSEGKELVLIILTDRSVVHATWGEHVEVGSLQLNNLQDQSKWLATN